MYYIGGMLKHAKAITRVANPTINSYKRLARVKAPCYISWSAANRSALVAFGSPRNTPVPSSEPDTDVQPVSHVCLHACSPVLMVLKIKLCLLKARTRIYHPDEKAQKTPHRYVPGSLMESNAALLKDRILCRTLGDHVVTNLSSIAQMETDSFRLAVHPGKLTGTWQHTNFFDYL